VIGFDNLVSFLGNGRYMFVSMLSEVERGGALIRKVWATVGMTSGLAGVGGGVSNRANWPSTVLEG
jgi:hypothetical protein